MMSRPNASYTRIFHGSFQFFESSDAPSRLRSSILLIALRWSVRMPEAILKFLARLRTAAAALIRG